VNSLVAEPFLRRHLRIAAIVAKELLFSLLLLVLFLAAILLLLYALHAEFVESLPQGVSPLRVLRWLLFDEAGELVWHSFAPAAARTSCIVGISVLVLFVAALFMPYGLSRGPVDGLLALILILSSFPAFTFLVAGIPATSSAFWPGLCLAIGDLNLFTVVAHCRSALIREQRELYCRVCALLGRPLWLELWPRILLLALESAYIRAAHLLSGTVAIEVAFNVKGLGALALSAVLSDEPDYRMLVWVAAFGFVAVRVLSIFYRVAEAILAAGSLSKDEVASGRLWRAWGWRIFWSTWRAVPSASGERLPKDPGAVDWQIDVSPKLEKGRSAARDLSSVADGAWRGRLGGGAFVFLLGAFCCLVAVVVLLGDYSVMDVDEPGLGPSLRHPLGTNTMGEDVLGLVALGGRQLWLPLLCSVSAAVVVAALCGAWAGTFAGTLVDKAAEVLVELLESIPKLIVVLAAIAFIEYEHYVWKVFLVITATFVPSVYRSIRSDVAKLSSSGFITAMKTMGVPWRRIVGTYIIRKHVFPLILLHGVMLCGYVMLFDAILGYVQIRQFGTVMTWGNMLGQAWDEWQSYTAAGLPYNSLCVWAPLAAIVVTIATAAACAEAVRARIESRR